MLCDHHCKWYPQNSFTPDDYHIDRFGVKHANKKKHICPYKEEEINHSKDCESYDTGMESQNY
jgi:hypothetical protein